MKQLKIKKLFRHSYAVVYLLAISVIIFLATLLVSNRYVSVAATRSAEQQNKTLVRKMSLMFRLEQYIIEDMARGFLSHWFVYPDSTSQNYGEKYPIFHAPYILDKDMARFKAEAFEGLKKLKQLSGLEDFSSHFLIAPGNYPEMGDVFYVPFYYSDTEQNMNADEYVSWDQYNEVRRMIGDKEGDWHLHDKNSYLRDYAISFYVPLLRENHDLFGFFSINLGFKDLKKYMDFILPYGKENSSMTIYDEIRQEVFFTIGDRELSTETVAYLSSNNKNSLPSDISIYEYKLKETPWQITTACRNDAIYKEVWDTTSTIFTIAMVGMIIMLICSIAIFGKVSKYRRKEAAAESELSLAASVQSSMLKPSEAGGEDFGLKAWIKPALQTGGDLYDYIIKEGKVIFAIGDVSGKGIGAAMFMAQVCSLLRSAASATDDPAKIAGSINSTLSEDNSSMTFCTMIVGALDLSCGRLELCNAGHTIPIEIRDGKARFHPLAPSFPVGFDKNYQYCTESIDLNPGDSIFLYTDGVNEAKNSLHEQYGEQRILDCINRNAGMASFSSFIEDLHSFVGSEPQFDDITLLCCKWKGAKA